MKPSIIVWTNHWMLTSAALLVASGLGCQATSSPSNPPPVAATATTPPAIAAPAPTPEAKRPITPPVSDPVEAGVVNMGAAMLVGGTAITDDALKAATEDFKEAFQRGIHHFRRCYGAAAQKQPDLVTEVWVEVLINPDGSLQEARPDERALPNDGMVSCVLSAFARLHYKPHSGEMFAVTAPVAFRPE